ncbi:MAG: DUF72 domain-containing protein [Pseudomonadota bacterium]
MIALGAWDWRHADWVGGFYPEDLPPDWRLTFYANEYDAVGLRAEDWLLPAPGVLRDWVEDTREGFRFLLEWPETFPAGASEGLGERLAILAPRLGALLTGDETSVHVSVPEGVPVWARERVAHDFVEALETARPPLLLLGGQGLDDLREARRAIESLGARGDAIILVEGAEVLSRLSRLRTLRDLSGWQ